MDTLGANLGWWLELRCACGRVALLPVAVLAERHGPGARLPVLMARMRCQGCGAKPATADLVDDPHTGGGSSEAAGQRPGARYRGSRRAFAEQHGAGLGNQSRLWFRGRPRDARPRDRRP